MAQWISTPEHGYLILTPEELERIPDFARRASYEEDVEWSIAFVALPEIANTASHTDASQILTCAHDLCRDYYPDVYERLTGKKATVENSKKRRNDKFYADHRDDWLVISAAGDWKNGVPKGFVECVAVKGGHPMQGKQNSKEALFLVKKDRYAARGDMPYVIRSDDQRVELESAP